MNDVLLGEDYDLQIADGDLVVGLSDNQHQACLLLAEKGSFKQFPTMGVGLTNFLKDDSPADLLREVRLEFSTDGMKVKSLGMENGKLLIDASYD